MWGDSLEQKERGREKGDRNGEGPALMEVQVVEPVEK